MTVRLALKEEKKRIKELWLGCFDDSLEYTNYYFDNRYDENNTLVVSIKDAESNEKIVSALQLNQYKMMLRGSVFNTSYIVGVCTDKEYRGRGYMGRLMEGAFEEVSKRGQGFIVLKPITEDLYLPYGFRYCFDWEKKQEACPIEGEETRDMEFLKKCYEKAMRGKNAYAVRDSHYYEGVFSELKAEGGKAVGNEKGYTLYYPKTESIREQIKDGKVLNPGLDIMARITSVETLLRELKFPLLLREKIYLKVEDKFILKNNQKFVLTFFDGTCKVEKTDIECSTVISIGELTQLVFGYRQSDSETLNSIFKPAENYFIEEI